MVNRVFLLSPANTGGVRGRLLLGNASQFELAQRFRAGGATLAEIYVFISSLYFRGKIAYSTAFASPPATAPGAVVITPGHGLLHPDTAIGHEQLRAIAAAPIEDPAFAQLLRRDAQLLNEQAGPECLHVLLGSIATEKYVAPLIEVFGERLVFPSEFVGRGDMSRGGIMLRAASSGAEMTYIPIAGAPRHGARPPKLPRKTVSP
jgi:hypothetical protein